MATVTITTDAGQDARLAPAYGKKLGLPGNANTAQVKAYLISVMQADVLAYEREESIRVLTATPFTPV